MSVIVIGLSHSAAPLELLERVSVDSERLPKALADLCARPSIAEAVVLSTCNRTEVYVSAERFHGAYDDVRDFFGELADLPPDDFGHYLHSQFEEGAARHLFSVAAGLESAVLGETEILGQVKGAWEAAQSEQASRAALNLLFRHAVEIGKRARTETAISRNTTSVSQAAVQMATARLGSLASKRVLVLGAGEMGEGIAANLAAAGVERIRVANRTFERALTVAERVGGTAVSVDDMEAELADADVLLTTTGASSAVLDRSHIEPVVTTRPARPLLIVDVAMPRDVDPSVREVPGVTLLDIDDLRAFAQAGVDERRREIAAVRDLVEIEVQRWIDDATAREVAPIVAALHSRAERLRAYEVERFKARFEGLDERQRDAVDALTRGIVAKLLHEPTVRLKGVAGSPRGERLAEALRDLFDV